MTIKKLANNRHIRNVLEFPSSPARSKEPDLKYFTNVWSVTYILFLSLTTFTPQFYRTLILTFLWMLSIPGFKLFIIVVGHVESLVLLSRFRLRVFCISCIYSMVVWMSTIRSCSILSMSIMILLNSSDGSSCHIEPSTNSEISIRLYPDFQDDIRIVSLYHNSECCESASYPQMQRLPYKKRVMLLDMIYSVRFRLCWRDRSRLSRQFMRASVQFRATALSHQEG